MGFLAITIPISILVAIGALTALVWSLRSGQFDDPEGPKYRMLQDEEDED